MAQWRGPFINLFRCWFIRHTSTTIYSLSFTHSLTHCLRMFTFHRSLFGVLHSLLHPNLIPGRICGSSKQTSYSALQNKAIFFVCVLKRDPFPPPQTSLFIKHNFWCSSVYRCVSGESINCRKCNLKYIIKKDLECLLQIVY